MDDKLLKLIDDSKLLKSLRDIHNIKQGILKELKLPNETYKSYLKSLKEYIFVNDLDDLKEGTFIRSISIEDDEYALKSPCIFCDVKMLDTGMLLLCRHMWKKGTFFHINMEKTLLFRKLKNEEKLILLAISSSSTNG
jgi:hypothetical protein